MERSKQKENGKDKTSMKLTDFWVKKRSDFKKGKQGETQQEKGKRHEKEKAHQKEIHAVRRKTIKKKKVATKHKTDEEKPEVRNKEGSKNKNEAEVKKSTKKKQLKGSKKRVAMAAGEARPSRIVKCSVTSESEPEFAESSDEESSPRKRGQQWTAQRLWDDLNFGNWKKSEGMEAWTGSVRKCMCGIFGVWSWRVRRRSLKPQLCGAR